MALWICLRWPEPPETSGTRRLALALLQFSPNVACFRGDSVVMEVAASLSLFGGARTLYRHIRQAGAIHLKLSMAPSASGAWLLAGTGSRQRRALKRATLERLLDALPTYHLPEALPHLRWLENIGCHRLGQLRRLPRQGLQQRSSQALLSALDTAYAQRHEPVAWLIPPGRFRQGYELDFHLHQAEAVLAAAQPLLQALCDWLHHRQEALHDLHLVLHHEKGRHAAPPTRVSLRFSDAAWRIEDFNRLLKERLQHCPLQRAAIRLDVVSGSPHLRLSASDTLFPDPTRHAQEERRLLDLLAARLGPEGIRRPRPEAHHLPEMANRWAADTRRPDTVPATVGNKPRPFWLLARPEPLLLQQERPCYQGRPLRLIQGPERLETGWYLAHAGHHPLTPAHIHQRRDYFIAEDADGARYWVFRERETGETWFLHGLFA